MNYLTIWYIWWMKNWIVSKSIGIRCEKCTKHEIGDELHYILNCTSLQRERNQYLPASYTRIIIKTISFKHTMSNSKQCFFKENYVNSFIRKINRICSPNSFCTLHFLNFSLYLYFHECRCYLIRKSWMFMYFFKSLYTCTILK